MYNLIGQQLLTQTQCINMYKGDIIGLGVIALLGLICLGILSIIAIRKHVKMKQFIKESKLEKKFQEWKNDNKGLD